MIDLKTELDSKQISKNCFLRTYITYDEKTYILQIDYKSGRFVAEKQFSNNYEGIVDMEEMKNQFRSEEDVKRHFDIF